MNKWFLMLGLAAGLIAAIVFSAPVYAQAGDPPTPQAPGGWHMGGRGMMNAPASGWMHDDMVAAFADQLGLSVDEVEARLADGETMIQIALDEGMSYTDAFELMNTVRSQVIDQALADGTLTQDQADWMGRRGGGRMGGRGCLMGGYAPAQ